MRIACGMGLHPVITHIDCAFARDRNSSICLYVRVLVPRRQRAALRLTAWPTRLNYTVRLFYILVSIDGWRSDAITGASTRRPLAAALIVTICIIRRALCRRRRSSRRHSIGCRTVRQLVSGLGQERISTKMTRSVASLLIALERK
jgi:hypothetical protein